MPKSSQQKLKILKLMKIFLEETDELHKLSTSDIILKLAEIDINVERKTIYDDIETLRQFGIDIVLDKISGYYVASRDFELPELKLMVDAVQSSKFITQKKSIQLLEKLQSLTNKYDAQKLNHQIFVQNRIKSMNESIYYNVDAIHAGILRDYKISFRYFDYNIKKERVFRKNGQRYIVSPISLLWNEEKYYLVAHSDDRDGFSHYRVDKMDSARLLIEQRRKNVDGFDIAEYSKKIFGMYGGEETDVTLRVHNSLITVFIDRFGKEIEMFEDGDEHFTVTIGVALSPVFYGWLFQFGEKCEVISPPRLIDELRNRANQLLTILSKN